MTRNITAEAIYAAVLDTYLKPLEKMVERRARFYLFLSEEDPFEMDEAEARKHNARLQEVGEEIETLSNVKAAAEELFKVYQSAFVHAEAALKESQHQAYQLSLDLITTRQLLQTAGEWESFLLEHSIRTIRQHA